MFYKKILIILALSFTFLQADIIEVKPYEISSKHDIQKKEAQEINTGLAIDIKTKDTNKLTYRVAYEGDYMIMNDYLEEEKQIKKENIYIGIGYKF